MARWQRDPKARRNVAHVLAAVEAVALTANFYPIFSAYLQYVNVALLGHRLSGLSVIYVSLAAAAVCLGVAVVVGVMYARNRAWARCAFIAANGLLLALGLLWFTVDRLGAQPEVTPAIAGLVLPVVTLFPLLWPLVVFRPALREGADASDAG